MNTKQGFFPPLAFEDEERHNAFRATTYGKYLQAMREPSLWELSEDHSLHNYRFLWLRTFHQPIVTRLTISELGEGQLTTKLTDGQGGYEPGMTVFDKTISLSQHQVNEFLNQLQELKFWELPSRETRMGFDGGRWILEGIKGGTYHMLNRWSPQEGEFRRTALMLVRFADIAVEEVY